MLHSMDFLDCSRARNSGKHLEHGLLPRCAKAHVLLGLSLPQSAAFAEAGLQEMHSIALGLGHAQHLLLKTGACSSTCAPIEVPVPAPPARPSA